MQSLMQDKNLHDKIFANGVGGKLTKFSLACLQKPAHNIGFCNNIGWLAFTCKPYIDLKVSKSRATTDLHIHGK